MLAERLQGALRTHPPHHREARRTAQGHALFTEHVTLSGRTERSSDQSWPAGRTSTFLWRVLARVRFAYVSFLEFGNGRSRFVNQVNDRCFDNRRDGRLRVRFFPRKLSRLGALGLGTFLWLQGSRGSLSCFTSYGPGGLPRPTAHCRLSFTYGHSLFALSHYRLHCRVRPDLTEGGPDPRMGSRLPGWLLAESWPPIVEYCLATREPRIAASQTEQSVGVPRSMR